MKKVIISSLDIFGMSEPKKGIARTLRSRSGKLMEHVLKLYLYPKNQNKDHWIDEIYAFLNQVPVFKYNKRLPDCKFILDNTYYIWEDSIDIWIDKIIKCYGVIRWHGDTITWNHKISQDFHSKSLIYFTLLADELSNSGRVTRSEVKDMLLESKILQE